MRNLVLAVLVAVSMCSCTTREQEAEAPPPPPAVLIETSHGTIKAELWPDKAPLTVSNFLAYVDAAFYDGTVFHGWQRQPKDRRVQRSRS